MRLLIAPDSFKESAAAVEVARAIANGVRRGWRGAASDLEIDLCPIADGGEGTVDALLAASGGERRIARTTGPLGEPVEAVWGVLPDRGGAIAIAEMAATAGLPLVPPDLRNPLKTSTHGVGELLREIGKCDELADGGEILIGLGGSATVDGGVGMAKALGVEFIGVDGRPLTKAYLAGEDLETIAGVEADSLAGAWPLTVRDGRVKLTALVDVENPLLGDRGAARVFGPQKGATPEQVERLEKGLENLANILRRDLGKEVGDLPGSGAAGGLAAGIVAFLDGKIRSGVEAVFEALDFEKRLEQADLVITGEGSFDRQSLDGKGPGEVVRRAAAMGKKSVIVAGRVSLGSTQEGSPDEARQLREMGIVHTAALLDRAEMNEAMSRAVPLLESAASEIPLSRL